MTDTTNLRLPCIEGAQAQKHVTHNDALRMLDALVQLAVLDRDLSAPPVSPAEGQRWIVKAGGTDAWSGHDNAIAAWQDGAWQFSAPQTGWLAYVADESALLVWSGSAWTDAVAAPAALDNLSRLGLGTVADVPNPLSAKLNNALFAAKTVAEGGDGSLRYKLSKEGAADTLSLLFQDDFSGRAEIGLSGDDDLHVKVSPDGGAWTDALVVDRASGTTRVRGLSDATTGMPIASMLLTPGGDGAVSIWRNDTTRARDPRTATVASVSGDVITLTDASAKLFFQNTQMQGVAYLRVWNTSKAAPGAPAWVKSAPADGQLQVIDAASIGDWSNGETVQIGDPFPAVTPTRSFALDISPMLQNVLGAVFPQRAIVAKTGVMGEGVSTALAVSGTAESGSFLLGNSQSNGTLGNGIVIVPTPTLSPVSNSNLVFVREDATGATLKTTLLSVIGVFV